MLIDREIKNTTHRHYMPQENIGKNKRYVSYVNHLLCSAHLQRRTVNYYIFSSNFVGVFKLFVLIDRMKVGSNMKYSLNEPLTFSYTE